MSMSLDEFLGHKSSTREGGRILNWKKRKPPILNSWLHTKAPFVALWRHGWPRLVDIDRDGEKVREVWGGNFNCWEHEDVLKKQYRRTQDGQRVLPPVECPLCLLAEHLRQEVEAGRLDWTAAVFEFEADDPRNTLVLTAAGIYNGFNGELTRDEVAELRRAGIRRDEAWKQSTMAKCAYVFSIVDDDESAAGVQVCIETTALGDAVKRVIRDQMDALGETEGHPLKTPYAIRWEYRADEQEFSKKYRALALPKAQLTPEVHALIVDSAPPDIQPLIARGDAEGLRAVMETAARIDLPFDMFFGEGAAPAPARPARAAAPAPDREKPRRAAPAPAPAPVAPPPAPAAPAAPAARARRATKPTGPVMPDYPKGTVFVPCDTATCGAQMADTDEVCWKCGAEYALGDEAPPPPPPPKARTRAAAGQTLLAVPVEDDIPW